MHCLRLPNRRSRVVAPRGHFCQLDTSTDTARERKRAMAASASTTAAPTSKPLYAHLYVQVLAAIVIGILLGHFYPHLGEQMKPLGDGFVKLIKMMIAPIIFCTVVHGIASMDDMKRVGRVGLKALIYFEVLTTLALIVGLIVVNVLQPGA